MKNKSKMNSEDMITIFLNILGIILMILGIFGLMPNENVQNNVTVIIGGLILILGKLWSLWTTTLRLEREIKELREKVMGNEDDDRGSESPGKED